MNELYELKEKLCRELKKYNGEEVTTSSLEIIKKLSASIHYIDEIIEKYEEEENASYGYNSYEPSMRNSNRGSRNSYNNNSYARGRGRNARRDNMGRYSNEGYSRNNDDIAKLREMMMDAPTDEIRRDYERVIASLESHM